MSKGETMTGPVKSKPLGSGVDTCSAVFFAVDVHTTRGWKFVHAFRETPNQIQKYVDDISEKGLGQFAYRQATAAEIESEGVL